MEDADRLRLTEEAARFRERAERARQEASRRGAGWWGEALLRQSAEYYDRRAEEMERRLANAER